MDVGFHVKCPLVESDCNQNWTVLTNFCKDYVYKISRNCARSVCGGGGESSCFSDTDGRT